MTTPTSTLLERTREHRTSVLSTRRPLEILKWTFERFDDDVAMACSFEDVALLHMVHELRPQRKSSFSTPAGTSPRRSNSRRIEREWSLNLTRTTPGTRRRRVALRHGAVLRTAQSRAARRAVSGRAAWITSVKRVDAPSRAGMKTLMWDEKFELVKVNPLATWTDDDVAYYLRRTTYPSTHCGRRATRRSGAPR
jgi:phosphoadenosine phosphosulfate reductase